MKTQIIIRKTKFTFIILCCLFSIALFSSFSFAQDETIKVDTDFVTLPVTVLDRQGRYITNLQKENFQILEDGVEQEVSFFKTTEEPFTVFLLLDTSGSMKPYIENLLVAANTFVKELRPNDQLLAIEYASWMKNIFELTKVKDLKTGIKLRDWGRESQTITFDVVDYALKKIKKVKGRKAIVLFSDGELYGEWASAKDNFEDAEEQEVLIYSIHFGAFPAKSKRTSQEQYDRAIRRVMIYMRGLPQITGGRYFNIDNIANLERTFTQVANELGQQYSIGYYPKNSGKKGERREIKVKVNVPNVAVRARESYIVGSNKN